MHSVAAWLQRYIPDAFSLALLLTLAAFAAGLGLGSHGWDLVQAWAVGSKGMWSFLGFGMQMVLILVTGHVLAHTPTVARQLDSLSQLPRTGRQAVVLVSLTAMLTALLNWGLGLITGAVLARAVGTRLHQAGTPVHAPLLAASGFTGLCVWHGGLSGSAPLKVSTLDGLTEVLGPDLAAQIGALPLTATVFSPANLACTGALLVLLPLTLVAMHPPDALCQAPSSAHRAPHPTQEPHWTDGLVWPIGLLALAYLGRWALDGGWRALDPNHMNLAMLATGLLLAGSPRRYMELAGDAAAAAAGIIIQFPFYAGIRGILVAAGAFTALAAWLPQGATGLKLGTLLSAGLVNLFIPSGGGQWGVQGPLLMEAAVHSGTEPAQVVMALAWGDQWTNLLQPFWALPLLGITETKAGDLLAHTAVLAVVVGGVFALGCLL